MEVTREVEVTRVVERIVTATHTSTPVAYALDRHSNDHAHTDKDGYPNDYAYTHT